jgi:hypothetical protein
MLLIPPAAARVIATAMSLPSGDKDWQGKSNRDKSKR